MPSVTIQFPHPNFPVSHGQPLTVNGIATGTGGAETVGVSTVSVQVDNGPRVDAALTDIAHQTKPTVRFAATVDVPAPPGVHTVKVTATDDNNQHATASVDVLRDTTVVVPAPAIVIDIEPPTTTLPDDASVQSLVSTVQHALVDAAARLAPAGLVLAGPDVIAGRDAAGISILRLGIWLVDSAFPLIQPTPPEFPLPRFTTVQAQAGFASVSPLRRGHRIGLTDTPFGVRVPQTTLQHLADIARTQAHNPDVESIAVTLTEPNTAITAVHGSHLGIGFSIDITETLSVAPLTGSDPPQTLPHIDTDLSSSVGDLLDWLLGVLIPILDGLLLYGSHQLANDTEHMPGIVTGLTAGLPARVALRNTSLPTQARALFSFPQIVLNWTQFGVHDQAIEGAGDAILAERTQAEARVTIAGPGSLQIPHGEHDIDTTYRLQLRALRPDPAHLTWRLHPPTGADDTGTSEPDVLAQSATLDLDFVVPAHTTQGVFTIAATALETCGTDPTKTLTAHDTKTITVRVH